MNELFLTLHKARNPLPFDEALEALWSEERWDDIAVLALEIDSRTFRVLSDYARERLTRRAVQALLRADAHDACVRLLSGLRSPETLVRYAASLIAQVSAVQFVQRAAAGHPLGSVELDLLACVVQEIVMRGGSVPSDCGVALWRRLAEAGHPMATLPLSWTNAEREACIAVLPCEQRAEATPQIVSEEQLEGAALCLTQCWPAEDEAFTECRRFVLDCEVRTVTASLLKLLTGELEHEIVTPIGTSQLVEDCLQAWSPYKSDAGLAYARLSYWRAIASWMDVPVADWPSTVLSWSWFRAGCSFNRFVGYGGTVVGLSPCRRHVVVWSWHE